MRIRRSPRSSRTTGRRDAQLHALPVAVVHELRFSVYTQLIAVVRRDAGWAAFQLGADGKRRAAEFVIPDFVTEDELCEYLADLFHEAATPTNGDVHRID